MEGEKDVLGKADALLRRASGTGNEPGTVPMLTDLVDDPHGEHNELAREVFRRVMLQVEGRLAHDAAVLAAITDLRQELANAIGDAVSEAIAQRQRK